MAIGLMNRIWWRDDLDASEKLVLLSLADRSDEDGVCWYAVETICRKSSLSRRGVQKVIARLVDRQLLRKVHRHDRSNFYVIPVDKFPHVADVPRPAKERGALEYIEEEPDLFGRGERGAPRRGERGSGRGEPGAKRGEPGAPDSLNDSLIESTPDACGRETAFDLRGFLLGSWNELASQHASLPSVNDVSDSRLSKAAARAAEWKDRGDEEAVWRQAFDTIRRSKLLTGNKTAWNANLDWVLGPQNFAKIMEGNYGHGHDSIDAPPDGAGGRSAVAAASEARRLVDSARARRGPGAGSAGRFEGRASAAGQGR